MKHVLSSLPVAAVALTSTLWAQGSNYTGPATLVFGTDGLSQSNTVLLGNDAGLFGDDAMLVTSPVTGGGHAAYAAADYSTWTAVFGDEDNNGFYVSSTIGEFDAAWIPPGASMPPTPFDVYFSVSTDMGSSGLLGGVVVDEADILRLVPGGVEIFLSKAQIETAVGSTLSTSTDVNGFTVDPATGDLYLTFTATITVAGGSLSDGGIARIPGTAYTTTGGPLTPIATMTPGSAVIVLDEVEVDAMFVAAGLTGVNDLTGIELDPTGGTYTSTGTGLTMPNLWLTHDASGDYAIVSTVGGGVIPTVNGNVMNVSESFGIAGATVHPTALAFAAATPVGTPLHIDTFPGNPTTPGSIRLDVAGATPGSLVILYGDFFAGTSGGFAPRLPLASVAPLATAPGSWEDVFVFNTDIGLAAFADNEGYGSATITVGAAFPGIHVTFQAIDFGALRVSGPLCVVTQ